MAYFIWLYVANISNRFRLLASYIFRFGLLALAGEYLILAQHVRPDYAPQVLSWVNTTCVILILSWFGALLPSDKFILNVLAVYKNDNFLRNSLIAKLLKVVKYAVKHDLLKIDYTEGLYTKLITPKRLKWLAGLLYIYDLYLGYARLLADVVYFILCYFAFAIATWLYVNLTGTPVYYIHLINESFTWGIAIVGFLTFKVIFFPDWKTIRNIGVSIVIRMILHKVGVINFSAKLQNRLDKYQDTRYHDTQRKEQ